MKELNVVDNRDASHYESQLVHGDLLDMISDVLTEKLLSCLLKITL